MSPKALLLAAALASSTALVPAVAAPDASTNPPAVAPAPQPPLPLRDKILFSLLDRNGDGAIDQEELTALTKAIFAALDTNGDGKISTDEFAKAMPFAGAGPGMAMERFMHHGPGFDRGPGHDRFGMDGHGPGRPDWRQGENDRGPGPQPAALGDSPDQGGPQPNFASLDKNGDGVISPDEFQNGAPLLLPAPQQ